MVFEVGEVNEHNINEFMLRESWVNGKKKDKKRNFVEVFMFQSGS